MKNRFVNKGNYSLESAERDAAFEKRRGMGWEEAYKAYRLAWQQRPARKDAGEWPLLVDLELSSVCNLKCPMCYTITDVFKSQVKRGFLPFNIFTKIVDEIAGNVPALRLSLRGEAALHPRFLDCIRYAKQAGISEVSFLTNLGAIDEAEIESLVLSGADWITVSVDGMGETYEGIRHPLKFKDTVRCLEYIRLYREKHKLPRPVVKIQSIWPAIRNEYAQYYSFFSQRVDYVAFNPIIDYLGNDTEDSITFESDFSCPMLYHRLTVCSDGAALPCSNDEMSRMVIGNSDKQSIYDIWHGEALRKIRKIHAHPGGFRKYPVCKHCYLPRKVQEEDHFLSDGRKFTVMNYVSRTQEIGL
jgi:MoaA/NifB/PqqE/SkfB family radical SAM enzyme